MFVFLSLQNAHRTLRARLGALSSEQSGSVIMATLIPKLAAQVAIVFCKPLCIVIGQLNSCNCVVDCLSYRCCLQTKIFQLCNFFTFRPVVSAFTFA